MKYTVLLGNHLLNESMEMALFMKKTNRRLLASFIFLFTILNIHHAYSQSKESLRYEIDAKRGGMTYTSKDALPRGREFKRLDSSYYVGWMFEGTYKYEHAADFIGFRMAAEQLEKASLLMEKDFKGALRTRTSDIMEYIKNMQRHRDWDYIAYALMQCYSNMEMPDKVWNILQRCKKNDLQDEIYLDTYNYLAWTVHRNRFYTSSKYGFLKNSIEANEQYANKLLDSCALKIKRDGQLNKTIFSANYETEKMPAVWHYKSILYSYQLNIESGGFYYEKLRKAGAFPENNYATFCAIQCKFAEAETNYNIAKQQDAGDKRMKEAYYYASVLNTYKNENKVGIEELKDLIKANGSTPGFGWYNLALARNLLYDGQIDIAQRYAMRAAQFKEIHIGTTLGQSHYDFTTSLLQLMLKMKEIEHVKFLNKDWWFSPTAISQLARLTVEKYTLQFLIINQFAMNPERDQVIYKLFSTESTVSFDEVWHLIEGFSTNYFLEKFEKAVQDDKRIHVKRYYQLFVAKLLLKKEEYEKASAILEQLLNEPKVDNTYEKLFKARVFEAMIQCSEELKEDNSELKTYFVNTYPQLVPYSGIAIAMRLHSNEKSIEEKSIIEALKKTNIQLTNDLSADAIDVNILFTKKGSVSVIQYETKWNQQVITPLTEISYKDASSVAKQLPFYLFNIGNDDLQIGAKKEKEAKEPI